MMTELFLRDSVRVTKGKVKVFKFGKMGQNMKEHGKIMWLMEKENSGSLMVISMMVSGRMINLTGMVFTCSKMVISMKEILVIINMKDMAK